MLTIVFSASYRGFDPVFRSNQLLVLGHGWYNYGLLLTCFVLIIAMGIDIFGLGIIVTASTCDLDLTLSQIGILSSMSFAGKLVSTVLSIIWW